MRGVLAACIETARVERVVLASRLGQHGILETSADADHASTSPVESRSSKG
jgi:hypothetical protein